MIQWGLRRIISTMRNQGAVYSLSPIFPCCTTTMLQSSLFPCCSLLRLWNGSQKIPSSSARNICGRSAVGPRAPSVLVCGSVPFCKKNPSPLATVLSHLQHRSFYVRDGHQHVQAVSIWTLLFVLREKRASRSPLIMVSRADSIPVRPIDTDR